MTDPATPGAATPRVFFPEDERDACGVAFVAKRHGGAEHAVVTTALSVLARLGHRGATGADPLTSDGVGILTQVPRALLARWAAHSSIALPEEFGVGMWFLPRALAERASAVAEIEAVLVERGLGLLGWREVPVNAMECGVAGEATRPYVAQCVVTGGAGDVLERELYLARKAIEQRVPAAYACSFSGRTVCYKAMVLSERLAKFYPDLGDESYASALAVVHARFSTNTTPSWARAHPYRLLAHNGEINTLRGNVNWMLAREPLLSAPGLDAEALRPVHVLSGSDSSILDNTVELLVHGGRRIEHALAMVVPSAGASAFNDYHACLTEPWDGPAALVFTDGARVGARLDRNGLRPARWIERDDGWVALASELGVVDWPEERIVARERLGPGESLVIDTASGERLLPHEVDRALSEQAPYGAWLAGQVVELDSLLATPAPAYDRERLQRALALHGYSREDQRLILAPMAEAGKEPLGSMGNDAPLAVLSARPQLLFSYFRQLFAQVTNPPIDSLREALVMSLDTWLGAGANLLAETPEHCRKLRSRAPIWSDAEVAAVRGLAEPGLLAQTLSLGFVAEEGGLGRGLDALLAAAELAIIEGATILVLSDRELAPGELPIPSLLATSSLHHHLARLGLRHRASLVVEAGDAREVMHFCLLLGYGAQAVHPHLALAAIQAMSSDGRLTVSSDAAAANFLVASRQGVAKVMSKMGISCLQSYVGAQVFEALGLGQELVARHFTGTASRLGGIGLVELERACLARAAAAKRSVELQSGGLYQWRRDGEAHAYDPVSIAALQQATRSGDYGAFKKFSSIANRSPTLRSLLELVPTGAQVALDDVEPVASIVTRFKTGAMSFGSISKEAHETLAIAMNRLGGKSNTGEGGEDPARYQGERRSAIKQVASARFGVTIEYLASADELQIKVAQGAKPGEGGHLPGDKVDATIARLRHATVGVGLISPPPHHDIYSIEDLAQLIFDLRAANPRARIGVKLVAEVGVGTIAAGVVKAGADVIVISGDSGGTGASPLSSIKHAGVPWELGLAETQQALLHHGLRERVRLETDGQLKTGRDVAVAVLLGADEVGFASAALVSLGCTMMRVCHLNTCAAGIATQDPKLRRHFAGEPEHVLHFMRFVAEELRELMASLGFRSIADMVGRTDCLAPSARAAPLDLRGLLARPEPVARVAVAGVPEVPTASVPGRVQAPSAPRSSPASLDERLLPEILAAVRRGERVSLEASVGNADRAIGTRISGALASVRATDVDISLRLAGTAGQSFGAFLAAGVRLDLEGHANDYVGKGLSGGHISISPPGSGSEVQSMIGNVALYGATSGELLVRGRAGERFAVRNSGATAVVEGLGNHGCEYMTGGVVLVLGSVGGNFAAGMSGGLAYLLDAPAVRSCVNTQMVGLTHPDATDLERIRELLERHYRATHSPRAWRLLASSASGAFVKVLPHEYRLALAAQARAPRELAWAR